MGQIRCTAHDTEPTGIMRLFPSVGGFAMLLLPARTDGLTRLFLMHDKPAVTFVLIPLEPCQVGLFELIVLLF